MAKTRITRRSGTKIPMACSRIDPAWRIKYRDTKREVSAGQEMFHDWRRSNQAEALRPIARAPAPISPSQPKNRSFGAGPVLL